MTKGIINISYVGRSVTEFAKIANILLAIEVPTKIIHIKNAKDFKSELQSNNCRLVIGNTQKKAFDIFKALLITQQMNQQIPMIGLYSNSVMSVVAAMEKGMSDYVENSNDQHLQLVLQRELNYLQLIPSLSDSLHSSEKDFTGLLSRLQFLDILENELSARLSNSKYTAIFYIQLDNFAWINESLGIVSGDQFLKSTAKVITELLDETDVAGRYQGGSFVMLVSTDNLNELNAKATIIKEAIAVSNSQINGEIVSSSCSIGIRMLKDAKEQIQLMISDSFEASDSAKANGGDTVSLFSSENEEEHDQIMHSWDNRIREAYDKDLLHLFYQPIVSLKGDTKPRYEVLLRMIDEEDNIIAPGDFLPSAERAGLMADIDRRVILYAFEKSLEEHQKGNNTEIFIKLSGKSLDDKTMPGWIKKTIKKFDIVHENIVFEITEALALSHLSHTRRMIDSLKKLNCKIIIDHFGTRLKSLQLLDLVEVDYLKIDGNLVNQLRNNKSRQIIVKKILKIAKKKNIQIMASAVQDVNMLPIIWQHDFHFVQGYFLQIPDRRMEYDFSNLIM